jgi:hypothetical protein
VKVPFEIGCTIRNNGRKRERNEKKREREGEKNRTNKFNMHILDKK